MIDILRKSYIMPILISLVGIMAYANTFTVPFQFDDDAYIVNNPIIRTFNFFLAPGDVANLTKESPIAVPPALRYAFRTRILGYLSFAVDYHLHGLHVAGYHMVNLAIHIFCAILVYCILMTTLKIDLFKTVIRNRDSYPDQFIAGMAALLFVSHPIHTQAVTYISQRFASQATFFALLSLFLYIRSIQLPTGLWQRITYITSLLSCVAAMLTKEFTFILPLLIGLYDVMFFKGSGRNRIRRLVPYAATLTIIPMLVFIQQGSLSALDSTMRTITAADTSNISRTHYLLTQFRVIVLYLRLIFLPMGQNVDHDVPVYTSFFDLPIVCSFLLLFIILAIALWFAVVFMKNKKHSELGLAAFGIIWFFISLSVESSILPLGELVAEYRLYLPSIGIILTITSLYLFVTRKSLLSPPLLYFICVVIIIALSTATILRNTVWASETALWEDAALKSPALVRPHQNLGLYYSKQGDFEKAQRELQYALALAPENAELHNNLGVVYKALKAYDLAIKEYNMVLKLTPDDVMVHYNMGNVFLAENNISEAIRQYKVVKNIIPDYDEVHNNLGIAYCTKGQTDLAIKEFDRALQLNPENIRARNNREACIAKAR